MLVHLQLIVCVLHNGAIIAALGMMYAYGSRTKWACMEVTPMYIPNHAARTSGPVMMDPSGQAQHTVTDTWSMSGVTEAYDMPLTNMFHLLVAERWAKGCGQTLLWDCALGQWPTATTRCQCCPG